MYVMGKRNLENRDPSMKTSMDECEGIYHFPLFFLPSFQFLPHPFVIFFFFSASFLQHLCAFLLYFSYPSFNRFLVLSGSQVLSLKSIPFSVYIMIQTKFKKILGWNYRLVWVLAPITWGPNPDHINTTKYQHAGSRNRGHIHTCKSFVKTWFQSFSLNPRFHVNALLRDTRFTPQSESIFM